MPVPVPAPANMSLTPDSSPEKDADVIEILSMMPTDCFNLRKPVARKLAFATPVQNMTLAQRQDALSDFANLTEADLAD